VRSSWRPAACGDDDGGEEVSVVLSEFVVEPEQESVDSGEATFALDNQGARRTSSSSSRPIASRF
jgi:hypothetical protein